MRSIIIVILTLLSFPLSAQTPWPTKVDFTQGIEIGGGVLLDTVKQDGSDVVMVTDIGSFTIIDKQVVLDSTNALRTDISNNTSTLATKLNETDTTAMLATYLQYLDTISRSDTASVVKLQDGFVLNDSNQLGGDVDSLTPSYIKTDRYNFTETTGGHEEQVYIEWNNVDPFGKWIFHHPNTDILQIGTDGVQSFVNRYFDINNTGYSLSPTYGWVNAGDQGMSIPALGQTVVRSATGYMYVTDDSLTLRVNGGDIKWNGIRLITQSGDTAAWKSDLGTGGSTDSSSITYSLDTAKALNNTDIYFDNPITVNGELGVKNYLTSNQSGLVISASGSLISLRPFDKSSNVGKIDITTTDLNVSSNRIITGDSTVLASTSASKAIHIVPFINEPSSQTTFSTTLADFGTKANFDSTVTFTKTEQVWDSIAFSSTINVDFTSGSDYKMVVVTGACTINITDLYGGESVLWIIQDGTGSHTVTKGTGWGDLRGSGTISTTADAISVVRWQKAVGPGIYTKTIHWID